LIDCPMHCRCGQFPFLSLVAGLGRTPKEH
jgi:hypothetical protein